MSIPLVSDVWNDDYLVRIKLELKPDGSLIKAEIIDKKTIQPRHFIEVLQGSALRAIQLCQPFKVPSFDYERWKELIIIFNAKEMLRD